MTVPNAEGNCERGIRDRLLIYITILLIRDYGLTSVVGETCRVSAIVSGSIPPLRY